MKWPNSVWLCVLAGCCCLLLAGCSGGGSSADDQVVQSGAEPTVEELGLRLVPVELDLAGLSPAEIDQVARGSYLVNGAGGCGGCHTTEAGYMAGGREFPVFFLPPDGAFTSVITRNLTPDPETGLLLTEDEFIESVRTGKDFHDSTDENPQRLIFFSWHIFRFLSLDDLKAMFAFFQRIPPVRNTIRQNFNVPFPPVPFPPIGDGDPINDPNHAERGLLIPQFFSSGPEADAFVAQFNAVVDGLTPAARAQVGRGSYLVNAIAGCNSCHTDGAGDGNFDNGLIPRTVDVNTALYLAGGVNLAPFIGLDAPLLSRNLTPHPDTGLFLTEAAFIQTLRFGADFRRPGGSLRLEPHFPVEFQFILDDLQAIFAYLQIIPAVRNDVTIMP